MERLDFLREEHRSVARALREALRHDYGPERSKDFYNECVTRLEAIEDAIDATPEMGATEVADLLRALASVGSRVALLERSHLGEFSWPFAHAIREFAEKLFSNVEASGPSRPVVHVVAEGIGYQIFDDDLDRMFLKQIMIVAFPRHLRHHVLLHSIFGHELGHPALTSDQTSPTLFERVIPALRRGPLDSPAAMALHFQSRAAPPQVREQVEEDIELTSDQLRDWRFELLCDLFGLLLFGPAFAAAHRMILEPLCAPPEDYDLASATHPPYPFRKRLIADAMRVLDWNTPAVETEGPERKAEAAMLAYAGGQPPDEWNQLLGDADLKEALDALGSVFAEYRGMAYSRPEAALIKELLGRLAQCRPPISQRLDAGDAPANEHVAIQHALYAGWAFWFGREDLRAPQLAKRPDMPILDFLQVNRLCEQALLQQRAIDAMLSPQDAS